MQYQSSSEDIGKILSATHHDPHSILGIHPCGKDLVVRAFDPNAEEMAVIDVHDKEKHYPMEKIREEGFFEVLINDRDIFAYDLLSVNHRGENWTRRYTYSFMPLLGELDLHLWGKGTHYKIFDKLGAHKMEVDSAPGVRFAVWAPCAKRLSVVGDFNGWDGRRHPLRTIGSSGIWEIFIPGLENGDVYKYEIRAENGDLFTKADPFAFASELRPQTASVIYDQTGYEWGDDDWMQWRKTSELLDRPMSVYEVHLGSWAKGEDGQSWLSFEELAPLLADYCKRLGYTHIELMPISEYPYDASWGYQVTGYFSPTSRFGSPDQFKYFVDFLHNHGISIIVDWVPAHFPKDAFGLRRFDGTALYEHEDPRQGEHKDWGTLIFNFGRPEVSNFLISSALFWLERYHIDGIRVDAVASMIYLDYSKEEGEWVPNKYGGNENLEATEFLKHFNSILHERYPGAITIAEESTAFSGVSHPTYAGGLGFTMKWNMGWMHDMLEYFSKDPIYRKYHHNNLTFALLYAFNENFVLPISHDEVVYGKKSLLDKMPGDTWQKFANLRLFLAYMYAHPGKKLLFQGCDIGSWKEWNFSASTDWDILKFAPHARLQRFMTDLGKIYLAEPAMWENDFNHDGFKWIDCDDTDNSTISFIRYAKDKNDYLVFVMNFTPTAHFGYRVGLPEDIRYDEILNSDAQIYYGSGQGNMGAVEATGASAHSLPYSAKVTLPPLGALILKPSRAKAGDA